MTLVEELRRLRKELDIKGRKGRKMRYIEAGVEGGVLLTVISPSHRT